MKKNSFWSMSVVFTLTALTLSACGGGDTAPAPPATSPPAAPSGLTAKAVSSSSINLTWTDTPDNEAGFKIERSTSAASGFDTIGTVGADVKGYPDTGLNASTTYYYRVLAHNSAGNSGYSNTVGASTPAVSSYTLTVNKVGTGSGTVTGTGIACGSDCSQSFTNGTAVTLTAAADAGSTFISWSGCDSTSGAECTVTMNQGKTISATFNSVLSTSITITGLPETDSDGTYALVWSVSGFASSAWTIHEDGDTGFANVTAYVSYDTTPPYSMTFSGKPDGTYCYRVGLSPSGPFSQPACVTVARSTSATLRIINSSHYDMIDIRLNNQQQAYYPNGIGPGAYADFVFTTPGTVDYDLGVGFYDSYGTRDLWFISWGATTVSAGQTTTITFDNPTIGELLSDFRTSGRDWIGEYWCFSGCASTLGYKKFHFGINGNWALYDNNVYQGNGTVTLVSWPDYSSVVTFKLCSTCATIDFWYPFGIVRYHNGTSDWPIIEYVGQ